jgi:hypothetical protein
VFHPILWVFVSFTCRPGSCIGRAVAIEQDR